MAPGRRQVVMVDSIINSLHKWPLELFASYVFSKELLNDIEN